MKREHVYAIQVTRRCWQRVVTYAVAASPAKARELVLKGLKDEDSEFGWGDDPKTANITAAVPNRITTLAEIPLDDRDQSVFDENGLGIDVRWALISTLFEALPRPVPSVLSAVEDTMTSRLFSDSFAGLLVKPTQFWPVVLPDSLLHEGWDGDMESTAGQVSNMFMRELLYSGDWEGNTEAARRRKARKEVRHALAVARAFLTKYAAEHPDGGAFELAEAEKAKETKP